MPLTDTAVPMPNSAEDGSPGENGDPLAKDTLGLIRQRTALTRQLAGFKTKSSAGPGFTLDDLLNDAGVKSGIG
jgi:hypothetical protein